jgi:K+-sensing histidine kinase KdpD
MNSLEQQDLYAALLHEMKNNLVLMAITMERVPHTQAAEHDQPLDEARLLCQRVSERLMQALMIYKSDHGGMVLNAVDAYSPEDFVAEMAVQARYLQTPHSIETQVDANVPAIWFFDRNMLEMALLNAIHNSISYARTRIRISARVDDGMLCLAVEDDAEGYPPHILQAVADDRPLNSSGTGLGLRFASLIAKAHENNGSRGYLSLRNDDGSVFEIRVP